MILIAEDNMVVANYLRAHLKLKGYETIVTEDGIQAWEQLEKGYKSIALVITDVAMPNLSGIALVERMRGTPDMINIPVIFASGVANMEVVAKAAQLGKVHFLVKPLTMEVLLPKIRELVPLSVQVLKDKELVKREFHMDDAHYRKVAKDFEHQVQEAMENLSMGLRTYTIFNELHGLKLLQEGAEFLGAVRFKLMLEKFDARKQIDVEEAMHELRDLAAALKQAAQ